MSVHILILAAGSSSRMRGGDKLLEQVDGLPLLRRVTSAALGCGVPVTVALPPDRPLRHAALDGLRVSLVTVPNPSDGMAASLVAGLASIPADSAVLLLLADLPEITTADLQSVLAAQNSDPQAILRGTGQDGTAGHPVLFPANMRSELLSLTGDEGARSVLQRHRDRLRLIALPDRHATTDLDTPEDWAAWRAARD